MSHTVTIGPSAAKIVDSLGNVSPLPKPRSNTYRTRCTCGWRSAERATEEQAGIDGRAHVRDASRPTLAIVPPADEEPHEDEPTPEWADVTNPAYLDGFERAQSGPVYAVPTMLPSWNRVCGGDGGGRGPARGWLVVIGGNPGFGKTLFALLVAREALKARERTAFVSMEMHHHQLAARFYAMATGTDTHRLEKGRFDPDAMVTARQALRRLFPTGGLTVNAKPIFRLYDVQRSMKDLVEAGTKVFLVDYLQLIGVGDEESINRQVTEAITWLRVFAVEHQVLVVALSQFNRGTSGNYHETPRSQGLHGGMIIEACADQVVLLDHARYKKPEVGLARTWLVLDKNRHGDRVEVPILWNYKQLTAREGMDDERDQWPTLD